ncbi:L,D-transpeptidase family protein [Starkeya koreensis]|uniref:L,D-transpeptidase family protein n=1 Tax=Ancylobacter koreensis TaxID=266121 RepID=A0ABT0DQ34_9HYPH|nr:L,D-transpeptidase [Ancylobacter koreensis]MCK0209222.1 L,D-transpeptidase family protein [Ancylobacter koreensis]
MMVVRLGFAPAVALAVLATVGSASAQYNAVAEQDPAAQGSAYDAATGPAEDVQVPAAYDPYGSSAPGTAPQTYGAAPQPQTYGTPPGVRDPYAQPIQGAGVQQPPGSVPGAVPGAAPHVANAPYGNPASQPAGYPPGAYSGQQPAGMASPYGTAATQQGYVAPSASAQPDATNNYGANGSSVAMLPPEDQPETGPVKALPANLQRQIVDYVTKEAPGTIVIDTPNTYLYYVLPGGKAERYGIGVGREGFTWAGTEKISRKAEWADWRPPAEMIERQPYLPRFMAGGPGNPLGARTMYLGGTIYRIHGTNQPSTIGKFMSSGCIRMLNEDVENLYERVKVGTKVVVLPGNSPATASTATGSVPNTTAAVPVMDTGVAVR